MDEIQPGTLACYDVMFGPLVPVVVIGQVDVQQYEVEIVVSVDNYVAGKRMILHRSCLVRRGASIKHGKLVTQPL